MFCCLLQELDRGLTQEPIDISVAFNGDEWRRPNLATLQGNQLTKAKVVLSPYDENGFVFPYPGTNPNYFSSNFSI